MRRASAREPDQHPGPGERMVFPECTDMPKDLSLRIVTAAALPQDQASVVELVRRAVRPVDPQDALRQLARRDLLGGCPVRRGVLQAQVQHAQQDGVLVGCDELPLVEEADDFLGERDGFAARGRRGHGALSGSYS